MEKLSKYSWVFLLLGVMGSVVTLSLLFIGIFTDALSTWTWGVGVSTLALYGIYGYLDVEAVKSGATSRTFRYSTGSFAIVLVAGAIGAILFKIADDHDKKWDLTSEHRFQISDKTRTVVQGIDKKVVIYGFFPTYSPERKPFEDLVEFYQQENPEFVEVRMVDPMSAPRLAKKYTITSETGTVVLESGDDSQRLESDFEEEALTDALIRLLSGKEHRICWSIGHGEADLDDDSSGEGFGAVVLKLEDQNYTFTKTNVLAEGIDEECEALAIIRPERDWLPIERERLAVYVAQGGGVLLMLEPDTVPELAREMARYGIEVGDDLVIDVNPRNRLAGVDDPSVIVLTPDNYAMHAITRPLRAISILWVARSVGGDPLATGLRVHELLQASEDSWAETSLDAGPNDPEAIRPTPGKDRMGSIPLGVAVEVLDPDVLEVGKPRAPVPAGEPTEDEGASDAASPTEAGGEEAATAEGSSEEGAPEAASPFGASVIGDIDVSAAVPDDFEPMEGGRIVVFGDSDFASNQLVANGNNQDLFDNAIAWLVEEQDQIAAGPQKEGDLLTLSLLQIALLWLISVFLVPGAAVGLSVMVMLRRRFL